MKITLFGATGGLGKEILKQGLEKGYSINALVRTPEKVETKHKLLQSSSSRCYERQHR